MQKNDLVTVAIEDIGVGGEGIGKVDGYTLFIKDAIIGDVVEAKIVKAKKNYGYARLMNIVTPSENRVEKPVCPMARRCGGCQIQEMKYGAQLAFKEGKVRGNLERIGEVPTELLDKVMQPIVGMEEPFHYRNKAQFPIGTDKEGHIITGFYAGRTHSIIPNTDCALGVAVNQKILEIILHFMENNHISAYDEEKHKGLVRHEIKLLWGQTYITDYIGNVKYQISPLSFYQVNPVQTEKLYGLALDYADLNGNETVWDLYCGIGTISLFLAQKAKQVYGVEIVPQAIDDARNNAKINDITNAEFYVGKAEEVLPEYYREYQESHGGETAHADVIVVDPPRKGCEESLLQTIVDMQPEKVVYVSCDSATLARDVKFLRESGYELKKITPVDQFPNTVHVECVVALHRVDM